MLQRTTTRQVLRVYGEFLRRYPHPEALLGANYVEVETLLRPLGLRGRVKVLFELARLIVNELRGAIDCSRDVLKKLPGVGDYVLAEFLLAYCSEPESLLDVNAIRVLSRVFGTKPSKQSPYKDRGFYEFAKSLVPREPELARAYNYGLLDFGREVCKARNPLCSDCALRDMCLYFTLPKNVSRG